MPDSKPGWQQFLEGPGEHEPEDEAQGGRTARGTTLNKRIEECFPAEQRNVFHQMDQVPTGPDHALQPFDWGTSQHGLDGIRGQNTWVLWGEGNEAFWGWLQEQGYGLVDFLVLLDSRKRGSRFRDTGMLNQPGMQANPTPLLGLYFDSASGSEILMPVPAVVSGASQPVQIERWKTGNYGADPRCASCHKGEQPVELFEPYDRTAYHSMLMQLPQDGVSPAVYGYPSGVVGLRLMPNPDFFARSAAAAKARAYWDARVVKAKDNAYYDPDSGVAKDPDLIRPFRVTMTCGFCHVGPHPLAAPENPEEPAWKNMSSTIGNQYWTPPALFANLTRENSLLYQFIASQQPGTVDTSLVSTDHINNANTITAIFDVNARLAHSLENPPEAQSSANLHFTGLEDGGSKLSPRHTPRVLIDGSDSIGAFGALSRVYLNIGTFPEEWSRCHNPILGFQPQRPFPVSTLQANSVFWRTAEKYRIPYMVDFFTHTSATNGQSIVAPMKLAVTKEGAPRIAAEREDAQKGREVFLRNCAICHSSKQPKGFALSFRDDWAAQAVPADDGKYVLPRRFEEWETFRGSAAFRAYQQRITALAGKPDAEDHDAFLQDNFLSTDIRIPLTLVGTNSGRAVATNGMRGQVWDNFTSEDYKSLPAVGGVRFFNPWSGAALDAWQNNDTYYPPPGGPGYYRPASLISLWATAPYLHNNALGLFNRDPSVAARLAAFDDGIDKLLNNVQRRQTVIPKLGDLRGTVREIGQRDAGYIYRVTADSSIGIAAKFVPSLLHGVLGSVGVKVLTVWIWVAFALVAAALAVWARARVAGVVLLFLAVGIGAVLMIGRLDRIWPWLWAVPLAAVVLAVWMWRAKRELRWAARAFFALLVVASVGAGFTVHRFAAGRSAAIDVGPVPRGVPINLVMNMNPEAPPLNLLRAVFGLVRGIELSRRESDPELRRAVFEREAAPGLLGVSKCPDFVLDRGHWFGEQLAAEEKTQLKAFLKTL